MITLIAGTIVGCGYGPNHLPKSEYSEGLQAFSILQRAQQASSGNESDAWCDIAAPHIDKLSTKSRFSEDLMRYESAVCNQPLLHSSVAMDEYGLRNNLDHGDVDEDRAKETKGKIMIALCADNVELWFHRNMVHHAECTQPIFRKLAQMKK